MVIGKGVNMEYRSLLIAGAIERKCDQNFYYYTDTTFFEGL